MRTTLTLEPDVDAAVRRIAAERGISFKEALNATLRAGLGEPAREPGAFVVRGWPMGVRPGFDIDKSNQLAAALDDEEIVRKLELGK